MKKGPETFKILEIRKMGFLARFWGVEHWKVKVVYKNKIIKLNCWAGVDDPEIYSLLWSIRKKLRKYDFSENFKELENTVHNIDRYGK